MYVVGLDADTELKRLTAVFERLVVGVHKVTWIGPSKVQVEWNRQLTDGEIHIKIAAASNELWYELGLNVVVRLVCRTDTLSEDKAAKVEDEQQQVHSPEKQNFQLFKNPEKRSVQRLSATPEKQRVRRLSASPG